MPTEEQKDRAWELVKSVANNLCLTDSNGPNWICKDDCQSCIARAIVNDTKITDMDNKVIDYNDPGDSQ